MCVNAELEFSRWALGIAFGSPSLKTGGLSGESWLVKNYIRYLTLRV